MQKKTSNVKRIVAIALIMTLIFTLLVSGCSPKTSEQAGGGKGKTMDTDVVVVGSGATGLTASIQAKQLGLDVILLEKNGVTGGTTTIAEGYGGVNTDFAKKTGTEYDVLDVFFAMEEFHHYANDQAVALSYLENSGENGNWLEAQGVKFEVLAPNGTNKFNTWHIYQGTGKQFAQTMTDKAKELGVEIILNAPGQELIMKDGKVAGIMAKQSDGTVLTINAPVVILATGGYAGSPEMIAKYAKVDPATIADKGMPGRTGDGINMALAVGASDKRIKGTLMNFGASMKVYSVYDPVNLMGWLPLLKVNQQGNRFIDEATILRDWGTNGNAQKQQGFAYHIVTQKTLDKFIAEGFPGYWPEIPGLMDEINKGLEKQPDYVFKADTIEELAGKINIDKNQLKATVDRYNGFCQTGTDLDYRKPAEFLYPVDEGPFYAFKFEVGIFATTDGLEVTTKAQVLDKEGKIIPGLYAGGGDAGGLSSETYDVNIVPGSQQGWSVNSGRMAAKDAADYIKNMK